MNARLGAFDRIASDIGVIRYEGESDLSYCIRTTYSASRFWVSAMCMDDGAGGSAGLSKQGLNRRLKRWLQNMDDLMPDLADWFLLEDKGIPLIYNRLIDIEDIMPNGFNDTFLARQSSNVGVAADLVLRVGFFDPTKFDGASKLVTSGLVTINSKEKAEPYAAEPWWETDERYLPWEPASHYEGICFANPNVSRWQVRKSDVWIDTPTWISGMALARPANDSFSDTMLLARSKRGQIQVTDIDWLQAQSLFFHLRAACGNPLVIKYERLDELHIRIPAAPIGFVPGDANRYIDAVSWPIENIDDRFGRIARIEALPGIEELLATSEIKMREAHNGR